MMTPLRSGLVLAALVSLAAGCGGDGDDSGPSNEQVLLVQKSAEASGAVSDVVRAANAGILASDEDAAPPGPHAVPTYPGATPAFDFGASVDVTLDFDSLDEDGGDPLPNASGRIRVTAIGTRAGDASEGEATFAASIDVEADVVVTNPDTGGVTTIPAGASWMYLLSVLWSVTDADDWTVTATATTSLDVPGVTVDNGGTVVTVDILGEREVVSSFTRPAGKLAHERSFEGSLATTVDDGAAARTVTIAYDQPGKVTITVLGGVFGPMSEGQFRAVFRTAIR
jgi:hypothetical protein